MRCFYHPDVEAVGTCKLCSRGLCPACSGGTGDGLACKGRHEKQVEEITSLVVQSGAVHARGGATQYVQFAIFAAVTLLLAAGSVGAFVTSYGIWIALLALAGAGLFGLSAVATLRLIVARRRLETKVEEAS